jgi:hypothetical protein
VIDLEKIDALYEVGRRTGTTLGTDLFNKRVLVPMPILLDLVGTQTGKALSEQELRNHAGDGWFPRLREADGGTGAPLYVVERIKLLLNLRAAGWTADELRLVAEHEELLIDEVLTTDGLEYVDDDVDQVIHFTESQIEAHRDTAERGDGEAVQRVAKSERDLKWLRPLRGQSMAANIAAAIEKAAFRVRVSNESLRVWILEVDRAKLRSGYSPYVDLRRSQTTPGKQPDNPALEFRGEGIFWESTIRQAVAHARDSAALPIRVPGFVLWGGLITSARTLRPAEYASFWNDHDIDGYLKAWALLHGEKRCLNCHGPLSPASNERKRFCGDKCRNAAKQRRFRERNPEAVERAQAKYWRSLSDLDVGGEPS